MSKAQLQALASAHKSQVRIYYEDTDVGGIVYYANYLKFAERARTELLRAMGVEQAALRKEQGLLFAVRRVEIDYLSPARLDDLLQIETAVAAIAGARIDMAQVITRKDEILARLTVRLVCIGEDGRPKRLSAEMIARFSHYLLADGQIET